jgi:very-short-patch-repair endonuclease
MRRRLSSGTITRARQLRDDATDVERRLWYRLREFRRSGIHFRRQVPFRGYYLDFAEHHARLVVELDGSQHGEHQHHERDAVRDQVLTSEGYQVLRFGNRELVEDFDRVFAFIVHVADERLPPTRPASPSATQDDLPTRGR